MKKEGASNQHNSSRLRKLLDILKLIDRIKFSQKEVAYILETSQGTLSREAGKKSYSVKAKGFIKTLETHFDKIIKWDAKNNIYIQLSIPKTIPTIQVESDVFKTLEANLKKQKTKKLQILDTWMPYLTDDRIGYLSSWSKYVEESIDIMILNPNSSLIQQRVKGLPNYNDAKKAREEIIINIELITELSKKLDCEVRLHLFDEFPGINCFITDYLILYSNFLSHDFSTNLFFHKVENNDNLVAYNVNTHFNTIWESRSIEINSENQVSFLGNSQERIRRRNSFRDQLSLLRETYVLFNLDEKEGQKPFQVSILKINDKKNGRCTLKYLDRHDDNTWHECLGNIEFAGDNNLLLKFQNGSFFLELLASRIGKSHEVIEALYLHTDTKEKPRASTCLLIDPQRMENIIQTPSRDTNDVDIEIREYLSLERNNILEFTRYRKKIADIEVEKTEAFHHLMNFTGKWFVYYPEKYPSTNKWKKNHYLNTIGRGILKIRKHNNKATFEAYFDTNEGFKLYSEVQIINLNGQYYLSISLDKKEQQGEIFIHLLVKIGKKSSRPAKLNATFNIIYGTGIIGSGLAYLTRIKQDAETSVNSLFPIDLRKELDGKNTFNLAFTQRAMVTHIDQISHTDLLNRYQGEYNIYSYGRSSSSDEENRCIIVGAAKVYDFGYIEIKSVLTKGTVLKSQGFIRILGKNLFFELRNNETKSTEKNRQGHIVLHVGDNKSQEGRIYCGVFSGLDFHDSRPLSKRIIFEYLPIDKQNGEYFDKFLPFKANINSEEYKKLNPVITEVLLGSTHNYIGFQRGHKNFAISHLKKFVKTEQETKLIFLATAAFFAISEIPLKEKQEKTLKWLKKGISHGLRDFTDFKNTISKTPDNERILEFLRKELPSYFKK